jgi:biotin carboxyl carrier protein
MRYFVTVEGRAFEIDLGAGQPVIEGRSVAADLESIAGSSLRHLLIDGRSVLVSIEEGEDAGSWCVRVGGRRYDIEVLDERARAIREMTGASHSARGPRPVRAPMPGLVVRLEVEVGESVAAGQGIVIVEAMKMENELKADAAGIVSRIHTQPGHVVEKGTILVEFDAVAAGHS